MLVTDSGVTVVVPVLNGEPWLARTVEALGAQVAGRPHEILVVDDGSTDGSREIAAAAAVANPAVRFIEGEGRGAAAAINRGVREARYDIVCQVDQDVEIRPGWMATLLAALEDPAVGAAQAVYTPQTDGPLLARVMGLDLVQRYDRFGGPTDHVCTGNTAYRARALAAAGPFDETLGYGYDNDMSYRLARAGYRLVICPEAQSLHHWRATPVSYLAQQYGFGYGRIDVLARHPSRVAGDRVSPAAMMAHPLILGVATVLAAAAAALWKGGRDGSAAALTALMLVAVLVAERAWAGGRAARRYGDAAALLFPVVHLARDAAWVCAIATWIVRWLSGRRSAPAHSMIPRQRGRLSGPNRPRA